MQQCVPVSIQTPFRFLPAILNNTKWQWRVEEAGGETKNLVADLTSQRFSFLTEGGWSLFYSIFGSRQSREETSAQQEQRTSPVPGRSNVRRLLSVAVAAALLGQPHREHDTLEWQRLGQGAAASWSLERGACEAAGRRNGEKAEKKMDRKTGWLEETLMSLTAMEKWHCEKGRDWFGGCKIPRNDDS